MSELFPLTLHIAPPSVRTETVMCWKCTRSKLIFTAFHFQLPIDAFLGIILEVHFIIPPVYRTGQLHTFNFYVIKSTWIWSCDQNDDVWWVIECCIVGSVTDVGVPIHRLSQKAKRKLWGKGRIFNILDPQMLVVLSAELRRNQIVYKTHRSLDTRPVILNSKDKRAAAVKTVDPRFNF